MFVKSLQNLLLAAVTSQTYLLHVNSQTTGAANCSHSTAFLQQQVDPSSNSRETFAQQYQIIDDYYKPGGPILFYQGAEGKTMQCLESTIVPTWAKELSALVVTLEHRFYGASWPSNDSDIPSRYETLTLDNVILDSVHFVQHIKSNPTNSTTGIYSDTPVVILGSSYGGFLVPIMRLNHPEVFWGAVAWASPVRGLGPESSNPDYYNWMDHVSNVYLDLSATAAAKIKKSLADLDLKISLSPNGTDALPHDIVSELSLCTLPANQSEYQDFLSFLVNTYSDATQYSFPYDLILEANALPNLLAATEKATNTSGVLKAAVRIKLDPTRNCTDWQGPNEAETFVNLDTYIASICKYYPNLGRGGVSNNTIFPPSTSVSFEQAMSVCPSIYNISLASIPTQAALQEKYHFTQADIENSTRMLFPMGGWDPVGGIGPKLGFNGPGTEKYTDRMASRAWVVDEMSHGEDSLAPNKNDKLSVVHAREVELQGIKEWLALWEK